MNEKIVLSIQWVDDYQILHFPVAACPGLRPSDWTQFAIGVAIAVVAASLLNYFIPRFYPWGGEDTRLTHSAGE
jgi:hypothetical protein